MKKCPFCAEEIQDEAIKCKHCGEFLEGIRIQPKLPWYARTGFILLCFLTVGPLALPLIWFHPRYRFVTKAVITVAVLGITWYLATAFLHAAKVLMDYYKQVL